MTISKKLVGRLNDLNNNIKIINNKCQGNFDNFLENFYGKELSHFDLNKAYQKIEKAQASNVPLSKTFPLLHHIIFILDGRIKQFKFILYNFNIEGKDKRIFRAILKKCKDIRKYLKTTIDINS